MTKEVDIASHLQTLTRSDWEPLFALIPNIERVTGPVTSTALQNKLQQNEETVFLLEMRFVEVVNRLGIVFSFGWPQWQAGVDALSNDQTDYSQLDPVTLCRFITAIVRNDRFCEGYLGSLLANGTIVKLLRALEQQVEVTSTD